MKILLIDNYDSFTQNIAHLAKSVLKKLEIKYFITTIFNDAMSIYKIQDIDPDCIIISPGPCSPNEAGICLEIVSNFYQSTPILGICLGHQIICQFFGGQIIKTDPFHGQLSQIMQTNFGKSRILKNVPKTFESARYHSLIMQESTKPQNLEVVAIAKEDKSIMAVEHKVYPSFGVQFHPESFLSQHGDKIFENFLTIVNNFLQTK